MQFLYKKVNTDKKHSPFKKDMYSAFEKLMQRGARMSRQIAQQCHNTRPVGLCEGLDWNAMTAV